jgi:hypothetical protein
MQNLIKIGITKEKQYNERMRFLESNGYRQINGLHKLFAIKVSDYKAKERLLQDVFSQQRIGDTELFCLNPELVKRLLMAFEGQVVFPEVQDKEKEFAELDKTNEQNKLFNFSKKGIKVGSIITFIKDKNITAKVINDREVEYNGEKFKLSPLALKLFQERGEANKSGAYQGAAYFEYNGKKLKDLPDIC